MKNILHSKKNKRYKYYKYLLKGKNTIFLVKYFYYTKNQSIFFDSQKSSIFLCFISYRTKYSSFWKISIFFEKIDEEQFFSYILYVFSYTCISHYHVCIFPIIYFSYNKKRYMLILFFFFI